MIKFKFCRKCGNECYGTYCMHCYKQRKGSLSHRQCVLRNVKKYLECDKNE